MDKDEITVIDNNFRFKDEKLEAEIRAHEEENIRLAEEREKQFLNEPHIILDAFSNGVLLVESLFEKAITKLKAKQAKKQH